MFKKIQELWKVDDLKKRFLFTLGMLLIFRFGSAIPSPGVNTTYFTSWFESQTGNAFNFFNAITGGSFSQLSIFALSISPYITASIIIQLLTVAISSLEELAKGPDGKEKVDQYTRILAVVLAAVQSLAMAIGFGSQGMLTNYVWYNVLIVTVTWTAGSALLVWIGDLITKRGIGNGISLILLINILSALPTDFANVYYALIKPQTFFIGLIISVVFVFAVLGMLIFTIYIQDGERRVPVQYSQKQYGNKAFGGQMSHIPIKVNTAGVIPVIFASSIMTTPVIIAQFFNVNYESFGGKVLMSLSSNNWLNASVGWGYSVGLIVYCVLIYAFAYFYTSITFNPIEIANNIKKQGGTIPGIRPGKPTSDHINTIVTRMVVIGSTGLLIIALVPIIASGLFGLYNLSFFGTSLIIIVGVILETDKDIDSLLAARRHKSFF